MKRFVVGAHYGLRDWLVQRVTGAYMALFSLVFVACLAICPSELSYKSWSGMFSSGCVKFFAFLFVVSLCYHAWIGMRDIWMDYVKPIGLRLALHLITLFLLVGYAGWAVRILWRL